MMTLTARQSANFWAKVNKTDTCWLWTADRCHKGYGRFNVTTNGERFVHRAHRLAYQTLVGPIGDGLVIDHICHTRECVRPDHLRQVTNKQNHEHLAGANRVSKSGIRGVSWNKVTRTWRARVVHNRRPFEAGSFHTLAEAEAAAVAKRNELFTHNDDDRTGQVKSRVISDAVIEKHGIKVRA